MAEESTSVPVRFTRAGGIRPDDETYAQLVRKRSGRMGFITRTEKKIAALRDAPPHEWRPTPADQLKAELDKYVEGFRDFNSQIEAHLEDDEYSLHQDMDLIDDELRRHSDLYDELLRLRLRQAMLYTIVSIEDEIKGLRDIHNPGSELFKTGLTSLRSKVAKLRTTYGDALNNRHIQDRVTAIHKGITDLADTWADAASSVTTTPAPVSSPSHTAGGEVRSRMNPIQVQVLKFDGDPLKWASYLHSIKATLEDRASGFTENSKITIIRDSATHPRARSIVDAKSQENAASDEILEALAYEFGREQVVLPLLVAKITKARTLHKSETSVLQFKEEVLTPYHMLKKLVGGDMDLVFPHIFQSMMSPELRYLWEQYVDDKLERPTIQDLTKFLDVKVKWMRSSTESAPPQSQQTKPPHYNSTQSSQPQHNAPKKAPSANKCACCSESHWVGRCASFTAMPVEERNQLVRQKRLCLNCLAPAHAVKNCANRHSCRHCGQRHHTLLHKGTTPSNNATSTAPPTVAAAAPTVTNDQVTPETCTTTESSDSSFLCSVTARLEHQGIHTRARLQLDHGSGMNLITEDTVTLLNLPRHPQDKKFSSVGLVPHKSTSYVTIPVHSCTSPFVTQPIRFSVVPRIVTTPAPANAREIVNHASNAGITLSDPLLGGRVDVLLGRDYPWQLCGDSKMIGPYRFIATPFGYGATGPLDGDPVSLATSSVPTTSSTTLSEDLSKLWTLDQVPEASTLSPDEKRALTNFEDTTIWVDGKIQVSLPFKENPPTLGDSRTQALSRFYRNEESLRKKGKLEPFTEALQEYISLGHAHYVPSDQLLNPDAYYLPVHGVFKATSTTTKVRPVFDASAHTSTGASLNDCLLVGPNLYPQLADVLMKFRTHPVGLSADISKMFREIRLDPAHQDLHRFILRDQGGAIRDCRMERLTFGVASSPFLATQTLRFLAESFNHKYPRAAHWIKTTFYVDDFVSGAQDTSDATNVREELCALLNENSMSLRKWRSNDLQFIQDTPEHLRETSTTLTLSESLKALGAHWDTSSDTLLVATPPVPAPSTKVTKRAVASVSAAVFDVLGFFAPTTLLPRLMLQQTWRLKLPWDKDLPSDLSLEWHSWIEGLPLIGEHLIPRRYFNVPNDAIRSTQLHGFADASSKAYGAVIYCRVLLTDGSVRTTLVIAKARVLPLKHTSIPRAELVAAHLLSKLLARTAQVLDVPTSSLFTWTDSAIVWHWLSKESSSIRDRFVANRVQACHDLLPQVRWLHVPTADNPADLCSRGMPAKDLVASTLWWSGPPWLQLTPSQWPVLTPAQAAPTTPVLITAPSPTMPTSQVGFLQSLWTRFSSLHKLQRVVAYIRRFAHNARAQHRLQTPTLTNDEIKDASHILLRLAQLQGLPGVHSAVTAGRSLPRKHPLFGGQITLQQDVLHIATRIRDRQSPTTPKLLVLLPPHSDYTVLLLRTAHATHHHPGVGALHAIVGDSYHVRGLRNALKKISRQCTICQRAYARTLAPSMGLLPSTRTTPAPPFDNTGVDYAGPFWLRRGHTRKPVYEKCWVVVFVCTTTKAVHIDLATSLSTEDFLATLTRFVARRGCPSLIMSDNGSNFLGARECLTELATLFNNRQMKEGILEFTQKHGIRWQNSPPRAPHFGGLWEAAVKQAKVLLHKNLSAHRLRFDEFYTLLVEIESVLNSRPMYPIQIDQAAPEEPLTPGHFLIGRPLRALPTPDETNANITTLRRWKLVTQLKQRNWRQWLSSYLQSIQDRQKWKTPQHNLRNEDLVYIKDESLGYKVWPLAKVLQVYPGDDGKVRAAKLLCKGRELTRAVRNLVPISLPDGRALELDTASADL